MAGWKQEEDVSGGEGSGSGREAPARPQTRAAVPVIAIVGGQQQERVSRNSGAGSTHEPGWNTAWNQADTTYRTRRASFPPLQCCTYLTARRLVAPTPELCDDAGRVLLALQRRGRDVRRASLMNDVLIALTARAQGAAVATRAASDFTEIRAVRDFPLEPVSRG